MKINFRKKAEEVFVEIPCKTCGNIMKQKTYTPEKFFDSVNKVPKIIKCINCNEYHDAEWHITHVEIK